MYPMQFIKENKKILAWLTLATLLLALLPVLDTVVTIGSRWKGVPQLYADEVLYYAQVREVAEGHMLFGNPYFYEHREDPTPALFGSNWLASIPFFLGFSLPAAIMANFLVWSLVYVFTVFYLLRKLGANKWSAFGALFVFIQSYLTVYRMSVRQEVFPFFFIFYIALFAWLERPGDKKRIVALAISAGTSFYLYSFFWQVVVVTLCFVLIYSIVQKFIVKHNIPRPSIPNILAVCGLATVISLPFMIYMWSLIKTPFYWESMGRFGLINTHVPTAEVVYSGSWVIILLILFFLGRKCLVDKPELSEKYSFVFVFFILTGLSMVSLQASNLITGKELETAQHIKSFIVPWLAIGFFTWIGYSFRWRHFSAIIPGIILVTILLANIHFILFINIFTNGDPLALRRDMQNYAAPLAWLDKYESNPVVIWSPPENLITPYIPALTKHYVLYAEPGNLNILSDNEVEDRYLTSKYLNGVSTTTLRDEFPLYAGRSRVYHYPKTLERKQKICRLLHIEDIFEFCPKEIDRFKLVGNEYFERLVDQYKKDIVPNITKKLMMYNVRYILIDKKQSPDTRPNSLVGVNKVYDDGRFEIYHYEPKK